MDKLKYQNLIENTNMCILPWVSLEATSVGSIRPCCLFKGEVLDESGNVINLKDTTLSEHVNGSYLRNVRQQFLQDKRPEECQRCWSEEDAGRRSKRINTLVKFKHEVQELEFITDTTDQVWFLDLKLGNICNLKCRICGSWSSSKWASEEMNYYGGNKKDSWAYSMLKAGNWPRENEQFWKSIEDLMPTIRYFEFTGGEPMMIKEHFDLLNMAIDMGVSENISIHYNTNATQLPIEALEQIWPKFKHVEVAFSIDNTGSRFEYERHGADWDLANTIINTFNKYKLKNKNLTTQLCFTINMFNVLYISELLQWAEKKYFEHIHWNMLHDPNHFNVSCMPLELKEYFIESLERKQTFDHKYIKEVESLKNFIRQENKVQEPKNILSIIDRTDKYRKESFDNLYPELATLLRSL